MSLSVNFLSRFVPQNTWIQRDDDRVEHDHGCPKDLCVTMIDPNTFEEVAIPCCCICINDVCERASADGIWALDPYYGDEPSEEEIDRLLGDIYA